VRNLCSFCTSKFRNQVDESTFSRVSSLLSGSWINDSPLVNDSELVSSFIMFLLNELIVWRADSTEALGEVQLSAVPEFYMVFIEY
jgi:hypothetical protein